MPEQLAKVVKDGDRLAALEVLRDRLAAEIDTCTYARDIPALTHQFVKVLSEIDALPPRVSTSAADQIADRRRARRGEAG
jgi:hypothetical protein